MIHRFGMQQGESLPCIFLQDFLSSSGFVFSNSIAFSSASPAKRTSNRSDMIVDAAYFLSLFDSTSPGLARMIPF